MSFEHTFVSQSKTVLHAPVLIYTEKGFIDWAVELWFKTLVPVSENRPKSLTGCFDII